MRKKTVMGRSGVKTAILTSSRADYGIYYPLLKKMFADPFFSPEIVCFGTHLSEKHGNTITGIEEDGFTVNHRIHTAPKGDSPYHISRAMGDTMLKFSEFWNAHKFELIIALGDRYEMFSAVSASVPFGIPIAHIHGGETTLGAFDNCLRNSITAMASWHFTASDTYRKRVAAITGSAAGVFNTGALSIDNLKKMKLFSKDEFYRKYQIALEIPSVLITFHPETIRPENNLRHFTELEAALKQLNDHQLIITMPNADTLGNTIREKWLQFAEGRKNVILIENFGSRAYLTCMKYAEVMLGNTSSGFIEASFFPKPVINLGDRQKGRVITPNIINVPFDAQKILNAVVRARRMRPGNSSGIYGNGNAAGKIIRVLKQKLKK